MLLDSADGVPLLRDALGREKRGKGQVSIVVAETAREIELKLPGAWSLSAQCRSTIRTLPGVVEVQEI